jgi:hypothetical protein
MTDVGGFPNVFGDHPRAGWGGNGHLRAQFIKFVSRSSHRLHVNGPWCATFEWEDGDAVRVNLEQYH